MSRTLPATARVVALLSGLAAVAWATGRPFVFPSLGPSAYALAVNPDAATNTPRRVLGGHAIGVAAGFLAYHALAGGAVLTESLAPLSAAGAGLALSSLAAVALTTAGMLATDLRHAPACATTLIVALGLLATPVEAGIVVVAVLALVTVDALLPRQESSNGSSSS
ncbi:HPP family protein [Halosegnis marinus]|uniref:HPP family protein n=1 Tax=Halosegnis marinus TaxID=3034023 RepID=A0ABD5ZMZ8_9EURY|nr:HPP family protein [Halosegnis sp. DT85]